MKKDLFQIGEVAKLFHISISTLRHYDKIGLVHPEYVDPDSGYRYYSTRQFECLNTIRYLRELDIPLEQISTFVQNRQIDGICDILTQQKEAVARRQKELTNIQKKIEKRLAQIADAASSELETITIEKKAARRMAFLRKNFTLHQPLDLEIYIRELEQDEENEAIFLGKVGIGLSKEAMDRQEYRSYEIVFIILDEEDHHTGNTLLLPEETCAIIRFQGSHERAPIYYEKLISYIRENGYTISGFSKEITMIDYGLTSDISEFVTEIQIPIL